MKETKRHNWFGEILFGGQFSMMVEWGQIRGKSIDFISNNVQVILVIESSVLICLIYFACSCSYQKIKGCEIFCLMFYFIINYDIRHKWIT